MVWVAVVAAYLIREEMPQTHTPPIPVNAVAPGGIMNSTIVAPWGRLCGKVYVQKIEGQPDRKIVRPCLIV